MSKQDLDELLKQYHFKSDPLTMSPEDVQTWRDILEIMLQELLKIVKANAAAKIAGNKDHKYMDITKMETFPLYLEVLEKLGLDVVIDDTVETQLLGSNQDGTSDSKNSTLAASVTDNGSDAPNIDNIYNISLLSQQMENPVGNKPKLTDLEIQEVIDMQNIAQLTILKLILVMMTMSNRYLQRGARSNFESWSNLDWYRFVLITITKIYQCNWQRKVYRKFRAVYSGVNHQDVQSIEPMRNNTIIKKVLVSDIIKYEYNGFLRGHSHVQRKKYESSIFLEVASGYIANLFGVKPEKTFGNCSTESLLLGSELLFNKEFWLYQELLTASNISVNYKHNNAQSILTKRLVKAYWKKDPNQNKTPSDTIKYLEDKKSRLSGSGSQKSPIGRCYLIIHILNLNEKEVTVNAAKEIAKGRLFRPQQNYRQKSVRSTFRKRLPTINLAANKDNKADAKDKDIEDIDP
jgi:hypothetical protein